MAALDQAIGNPFNDAIFANGASGSIVVGALTLTAPDMIHFSATRGTASTNGTDITGTATTTLAGKCTAGSASVSNVPTKQNTAALSITTSASGTWNGIETFDATGTPKRKLFGPTSDLTKAFGSGDILSVPISNATVTTT